MVACINKINLHHKFLESVSQTANNIKENLEGSEGA